MDYLDRNEYNFEISDKVRKAIKNFNPTDLCFYSRSFDLNHNKLVKEISCRFNVSEKQIILFNGEEDALKEVLHFFLKKEKSGILLPDFSWKYYYDIANECNSVPISYPVHECNGAFHYDAQEIIDLANDNSDSVELLLLASPNNPTGNVLTREFIKKVLSSIPRNIVVFLDEAYASFNSTDSKYVGDLVNQFDNLIVGRSFSKYYGLPGLRFGFCLTGNNFCEFRNYTNKYLGYNRFSEAIALAALESDDFYQNVSREMSDIKSRVYKEVSLLPGFTVYQSVANFLLIKYPGELEQDIKTRMDEHSLLIKYIRNGNNEAFLRLTIGTRRQISGFLDTLIAVVEATK